MVTPPYVSYVKASSGKMLDVSQEEVSVSSLWQKRAAAAAAEDMRTAVFGFLIEFCSPLDRLPRTPVLLLKLLLFVLWEFVKEGRWKPLIASTIVGASGCLRVKFVLKDADTALEIGNAFTRRNEDTIM